MIISTVGAIARLREVIIYKNGPFINFIKTNKFW